MKSALNFSLVFCCLLAICPKLSFGGCGDLFRFSGQGVQNDPTSEILRRRKKELSDKVISEGDIGKYVRSSAFFLATGRSFIERLVLGDGIFTANGINLDSKGSLVLQGLLTKEIDRLPRDLERFSRLLLEKFDRPGIDFPADEILLGSITRRSLEWPSPFTEATLAELVDQQLKKWGISRAENVKLVEVVESGMVFPFFEPVEDNIYKLASLARRAKKQILSDLSILHRRYQSYSRPTGFIVGLSEKFYQDSREFKHDDDDFHHIWEIPSNGEHLNRYVDFILPLDKQGLNYLFELEKW